MNLELDFASNHGRENNSHSEQIFVDQEKRLSRNTRIILECLLDGQRISGRDCINGITTSKGETASMNEYRKRMDELKRSGVNLSYESDKSGNKTWFLEPSEIERLKNVA